MVGAFTAMRHGITTCGDVIPALGVVLSIHVNQLVAPSSETIYPSLDI